MKRGLKRLFEILLIIALAVLVGVFALRSWRSAHADNTEPDSAVRPTEGSISAITYGNESSTLGFALDDEGQWYWTEYPDYPLDSTKIETLAEELSAFSPALVTKAADEDTLDDAGLTTPGYTLHAGYTDGSTMSFEVGAATDEGSYYMRYSEEERSGELYLIDKSLVDAMKPGIYDMYRVEELPRLTERLMDSVTVHYVVVKGEGDAAYAEEESITYTMKEVNGEYLWYCGARNAKDDKGVSGLMGGLVKLQYARCVVWQPINESLTLCGLRPWKAKVEVHYRDEADKEHSFAFSVGDVCGENERYVRPDGGSVIYTMNADALVPFLTIAGVTE